MNQQLGMVPSVKPIGGQGASPQLAEALARASALGSSTNLEQLALQAIRGASMAIDQADDHVLGAVARRLGDMWLEDSCSFCDVTLGVQRLIRSHASREASAPVTMRSVCSSPFALLSPAPGDQHGFGIMLVGSALARRGWIVTADVPPTADALLAAVRRERFDMVGLSVGHERALDRIPALLAALRRASCNRGLAIALGGPMLNGRAALAHTLGADLHADDADALDATWRIAMPIAA